MVWALRFNGSNERCEAASSVSISSGDDFSIKWRWPSDNNAGNHRVLGGTTFGATAPRIIAFSGGNVILYGSSGGNKAFAASIDNSIDQEVEFRRVSGTLELFVGGVSQGTQSIYSKFYIFQSDRW